MDVVDGHLLVAKVHAFLDEVKVDVVVFFVFEAELFKAVDEALSTGFSQVLGEVVLFVRSGPVLSSPRRWASSALAVSKAASASGSIFAQRRSLMPWSGHTSSKMEELVSRRISVISVKCVSEIEGQLVSGG